MKYPYKYPLYPLSVCCMHLVLVSNFIIVTSENIKNISPQSLYGAETYLNNVDSN